MIPSLGKAVVVGKSLACVTNNDGYKKIQPIAIKIMNSMAAHLGKRLSA